MEIASGQLSLDSHLDFGHPATFDEINPLGLEAIAPLLDCSSLGLFSPMEHDLAPLQGWNCMETFLNFPPFSQGAAVSDHSSSSSGAFESAAAISSPVSEAANLPILSFDSGCGHSSSIFPSSSMLSFNSADTMASAIGTDGQLDHLNLGCGIAGSSNDRNSLQTAIIGYGFSTAPVTNGRGEDQLRWLYSEATADDCVQDSEGLLGAIHNNKRPYNMGEDWLLESPKKHCPAGNQKSPTKDPQSLAAKNRRERISERLRILQKLVPNGTKVDLVTMLEKAISYVKFLQLQVKVLATDEFWPAQGGKAPEIGQVKEAIDAILSSHGGRNI